MRLNYPGIFFELYISLKRGDIKLPYGERIKFLTKLQLKLFDLSLSFSGILKNDLQRKWH